VSDTTGRCGGGVRLKLRALNATFSARIEQKVNVMEASYG
jgi:hypothetical protein